MPELARILKEVIPHAHYVGGIVRSSLLRRYSSDIDITLPLADVKTAAYELGRRLKAAVFEMDAEFGVWRVVTHKEKIQLDLTAYQGKNLQADLLRRDFAFNALAYPVSALPQVEVLPQKEGTAKILLKRLKKNQIVDVSHGMQDVAARVIDISHPRVFKEDPLRMLRAFRSSAGLGFSISPRTHLANSIN